MKHIIFTSNFHKMNNITHIIHIADLHVRTGDTQKSKYDEYEIVFKRLYDDLSTYEPILQKKTIIIIAGDIFHNKLKIESPGIKLVLTFLKNLGSLTNVYIIRGNHDYRQEYPNEPDLIESLFSIDIPNVTYWNNTGHFIVSNIGFGLVSIQDALMKGASSGITLELPQFPDPIYFDKFPDIKHKIALFHGAISKTRLPTGMIMDDKQTYPIEWFKGYDSIILGDIHLQQLHNVKMNLNNDQNNFKYSTEINNYSYNDNQPWGYPGSLLQQNFGEALYGHGFLIWNLDNKEISCYHVKNDYGYITLKKNIDSDDIYIAMKNQYKNTWVLLNNVINEKWFPSKSYIRFAFKDNDIDDIIKNIFKNNKKEILKIFYQSLNNEDDIDIIKNNETNDDIIDITSFTTPDTWCEYIDTKCTPIYNNWRSWFQNFETLYIPSSNNSKLNDIIKNKNDTIQKNINILQQEIDSMNDINNIKHRFHINYIEFENILCFKGINFFNFDTLDKNNILCINAANGCGKTSFLETICISLYGEELPSRCYKSYSSSIIYNKIKIKEKSQTTIYITINNIKFRIKRIFNISSKDINKKDTKSRNIILEKYNYSLNIFEEINSGATPVGEWIEKNIGTKDSFLLSCMITQNCDRDFFNLNSNEQKDLLDNALYITSSTIFHDLIKIAKTDHHAILSKAKDELLYYNIDNIIDYISEIENTNKHLEIENTNKNNIIKKYNIINSKINNIPNSLNILNKGKLYIKEKLLEFDNKLKTLNEEQINEYNFNDIIKDIGKYQNEIENIDVYKYINNYNKKNIDDKYKNINLEINKLSPPKNTLEYINNKKIIYKELKNKYYILYKNNIENIEKYIYENISELNNIENINNNLILSKDELLIKNNIEKELLEKHILIQPLQPRNTDEEYNKWINDLASYNNKYINISNLNSLYETYKNKNIKKPDILYNEVISNFNKLKNQNIIITEDDINENKNKINNIEKNIYILQNKFNENNNILNSLFKKQIEKPSKSLDEYNEFKNNLHNYKIKYISVEKIKNKVNKIKSNEPEIPHTNKNKLESNLILLQNEFIKYNNFNIKDLEILKKNNNDIKNDIDILKKECESYNKLYIETLSNKPNSPQKYMSLIEYYKFYNIILTEKKALNEYFKKFKLHINIENNILKLDKIDKYSIKLLELKAQLDNYNNILLSFEDHPYNDDCWACQKQSWKIQKNNIIDEITKIETNIIDIKKNTKKITGILGVTNYISKLKLQNINTERYNIIIKEENDFWIIEREKIINLIEWEKICKTYLDKYNSFKKKLEINIIKEIEINKEIDIINNYIKIKNEIDICNKDIKSWNIYNNWLEQYNILLKDYNDFKILDESIDFWNKEKENNKLYSKWQDDIKNIELDINNIQNEIKNKNELLILYNKKQDQIIYNDFKNIINLWDIYNLWDKELAYLLKEINIWNDLISKTEYWNEEKERIQLAIDWKKQFDNYNLNINLLTQEIYNITLDIDKYKNKIIEYKNIIENLYIYNDEYKTLINDIGNDIEIYDSIEKINNEKVLYDKLYKIWSYQDKINDIKIICEDIKNYNDIKNVYNDYKICYDIYDEWILINNDYKLLDTIEKNIIKYSIQLSSLEKEYEKYLYNKNNKELIQNFINDINERHESLIMIHEIFGDFKNWIYSEKVIPFLQDSANNIMNKICGSRPLYIESEITHSKTGTHFAWFLKDGLSRPHIKKASGFQKHMAGFAIRIALCQIGAASIKPIQLFLDECFTSADYDNLSRVNDLLQDLLYKYKNIIIVSHIDDIKSCANKYIDINRIENESISQLQYGERYLNIKPKKLKEVPKEEVKIKLNFKIKK